MNVTPESSYDAASLTHTIVRWLGSMEILRPDYRIVAAAAAVVVGRRWIDSMSLSALRSGTSVDTRLEKSRRQSKDDD
jgi:hypothetical protein